MYHQHTTLNNLCCMDLFLTTVAYPPTNLTYEVQDDFTSILLMWVPPSPLGDTTGYRISYNAVGGSSNSVDISDGNTSNYTLTGLEKGKDYNISIIGTSDYFFSKSVAWNLITLIDPEDPSVIGENEGGEGDNISDGESNTGLIAAGISIPLILLAVIAAISILVLFVRKRRYKLCIFFQICFLLNYTGGGQKA